MVINGKAVDMEERVWRQLLALPYSLDADGEGRLILTALQPSAPTWEELVTTQPILPADLSWKVETNADRQIIMSPPAHMDHQEYSSEIVRHLNKLLPDGFTFSEAAVKTSDGTKVPDLAWASAERRAARKRKASFTLAPEICVEIISPSNSRREIEEKKKLYLEAGALEVWRCERDGKMNFFDANGPIAKSGVCPDFPAKLDTFA